MATSKPKQDIGITTCPICLEEFKTPKCLPCLHNFCETCLNSYIITAFKSESKSKVGKSQFNCPVCRRVVTPPNPAVKHQEWAKQFPLNHTVVSLMDQNKLKAKEKLCDPCKSIDVIAVSWCHDCNEALCEACVNVHQKLKISKDHDIKNIDDLETLPMITSLKTCENHKGKSIEAFCKDHNKPCCATCVAIHHRKCDHVTTLEEAAKGILESKYLFDLLERLKGTHAINQKIISEKRKNIKALEDKKCDIQKELQEARQKIIDSFDMQCSTFMQKFTLNHNQEVKELTDSLNDIESRDKVIQNCYDLIESCRTRSSEIQVFLEMKKVLEQEKEQLKELDQIQEKHKIVEYEFKLNDDIKKLFTQSQSVGQINVTEKPSVYAKRYPKTENIVRMNFRKCMPELVTSFYIRGKLGVGTWVYGGCFMSDNTLLLPLFDKRKLALFKSNGDLIKQSGDLSGDVYDVCMIDPTTAVVTRCEEKVIDYINVPTLTVNKTVSVRDWCCGICCSDNKLYVGCFNKLLILDKDGNKEKEINTNGGIYGVTIVNQGEKKIVYTNYNNNSCHFVRSSDLQEVHRFTHPELKRPWGVTSDREGNVYIAGQSSGNVFQLSSEGDLIRVLLKGLERPCGIQFDGDTNLFFVSCSLLGRVKIYNMTNSLIKKESV